MAKFYLLFPTSLDFTKKTGPGHQFVTNMTDNYGCPPSYLLYLPKTLLIRSSYYGTPSSSSFGEDPIVRFAPEIASGKFKNELYKDNNVGEAGHWMITEEQSGSSVSKVLKISTPQTQVICPTILEGKYTLHESQGLLKCPKILLRLGSEDFIGDNKPSVRNTVILGTMFRLFWEMYENYVGAIDPEDQNAKWTKEFIYRWDGYEWSILFPIPSIFFTTSALSSLFSYLSWLCSVAAKKETQIKFLSIFANMREQNFSFATALSLAVEDLLPTSLMKWMILGKTFENYNWGGAQAEGSTVSVSYVPVTGGIEALPSVWSASPGGLT